MPYLNTQTNDYPRFDGDLELLGWTVGSPLPEGWVEVTQDPIPTITDGQTYQIQPPALVNGVWTASYVVRDMTADEIAQQKANLAKIQEVPNGNN